MLAWLCPKAVAEDLKSAGVEGEPITIRIVSSLLMTSYAPEKLVEHQKALGDDYPKEFPYESKALAEHACTESLSHRPLRVHPLSSTPCTGTNRRRCSPSRSARASTCASSRYTCRSTCHHPLPSPASSSLALIRILATILWP